MHWLLIFAAAASAPPALAGCSDAEPDDAYSRFRILAGSRDEKGCAWLHLGIVPPGAAAGRKPTPVVCAPANARVGGWSCRFEKP